MKDHTKGGKYRILENVKGDVIQEGDEMRFGATWSAVSQSFVGDKVYLTDVFRRPVAQEQAPDHTEGGKYRMLELGDTRHEGDEYLSDDGTWHLTEFAGHKVTLERVGSIRRPVAQEPAVTEPDGGFTHNIVQQITFPDRDAAVDALVRRVFGAEPVYLDECRSVASEPDPVEFVGVVDVHGRFNQSEMLAAEWDESYPDDAPHRDAVLVEKLP